MRQNVPVPTMECFRIIVTIHFESPWQLVTTQNCIKGELFMASNNKNPPTTVTTRLSLIWDWIWVCCLVTSDYHTYYKRTGSTKVFYYSVFSLLLSFVLGICLCSLSLARARQVQSVKTRRCQGLLKGEVIVNLSSWLLTLLSFISRLHTLYCLSCPLTLRKFILKYWLLCDLVHCS